MLEQTIVRTKDVKKITGAIEALSRVATVLKSGKVSETVQKSLDETVAEAVGDLTADQPSLQMAEDVLAGMKARSEKIAEVTCEVKFPNRLDVVEMFFNINNVRFRNPGHHVIEFWVGSSVMFQRKLLVHQKV